MVWTWFAVLACFAVWLRLRKPDGLAWLDDVGQKEDMR